MNPGLEIEHGVRVPPSHLDIGSLVAERKAKFKQKKVHENARKLIPITIKSNEPFGILHFGDAHLDDDGTDIELVEKHALLVRSTPGLWAATPGDSHNNWVGRLAALYGQQSTTAEDGIRLAEWWINLVKKWLFIVGGNHDCWSGAGDPLKWIAKQESALYQDSEVRIALNFPNKTQVRINCRHDFNGRSIYNPAHGPMKALTWGARDHIAICGHWHVSGYGVLKDADSGIAMHGIQVGSYKTYDRYAREKNFRDQMLGPSCLTIIDPRLEPSNPGLVNVFWDPEQGAEYLTWLRSKCK